MPTRLFHGLARYALPRRKKLGLTHYPTGQAVISVLLEDFGELLWFVEVVNSRTRFGRWDRHIFLANEDYNGSELFPHYYPALPLSHGFVLTVSRKQEFLKGRAFRELENYSGRSTSSGSTRPHALWHVWLCSSLASAWTRLRYLNVFEDSLLLPICEQKC